MTFAPLAHVTRSGFLESVHHGSAVALDAAGAGVVRGGDPAAVILPPSSLKPVPLLAMLPGRLGLTRPPLDPAAPRRARAGASPSGEPFHLAVVGEILRAGGFTERDLCNTRDLPLDADERLRWQCAGRPAAALAQNCSGKHAAMLATCAVNG